MSYELTRKEGKIALSGTASRASISAIQSSVAPMEEWRFCFPPSTASLKRSNRLTSIAGGKWNIGICTSRYSARQLADSRLFFCQSPRHEPVLQIREAGREDTLIASDVVAMRPHLRSAQGCVLSQASQLAGHRRRRSGWRVGIDVHR